MMRERERRDELLGSKFSGSAPTRNALCVIKQGRGKGVNAQARVCVCCIYTWAYLQQHTWMFPPPTDDIIFDFGGKSIN
jgi:hypothetical protein